MLAIQPRNEPPRVVKGRIFVSFEDAPDRWHRHAVVPVAELAARVATLNALHNAAGATFKGVEC
jgi:hypothetical protein